MLTLERQLNRVTIAPRGADRLFGGIVDADVVFALDARVLAVKNTEFAITHFLRNRAPRYTPTQPRTLTSETGFGLSAPRYD